MEEEINEGCSHRTLMLARLMSLRRATASMTNIPNPLRRRMDSWIQQILMIDGTPLKPMHSIKKHLL